MSFRSDLKGFHTLSIEKRIQLLIESRIISPIDVELLKFPSLPPANQLDLLCENVIGSFTLPFSIATNFIVNKRDRLIPMVTEEASVVAAASNGARMARKNGGFQADPIKSIMIGQILLTNFPNPDLIINIIQENKADLIHYANGCCEALVNRNGGVEDIEIHQFSTSRGQMIVLHILVNVLDAMGANLVNSIIEQLPEYLKSIISADFKMKIISNLATHRLARCSAVFDHELLGGYQVIENILDIVAFAQEDPFRAATHNKGIMNGISALALATGNDVRSIEAGAHAYAAISGHYKPLSVFQILPNGDLKAEICLPMAVGVVGGLTKAHPMVQLALKILDITSAEELSQIGAALGLAQNMAALRALADEGIQKGHMKLHKRKEAR